MKVKVNLNIGAADQRRFDLPDAKEGDIIDVDKKLGEFMLKKGWAVAVTKEEAAAKRPVPVAPARTQPTAEQTDGSVGTGANKSFDELPARTTRAATAPKAAVAAKGAAAPKGAALRPPTTPHPHP